jgi:hypothetical protein
MSVLLWWVLQTAVVTALLVPIVLALCRLLRDRPALQHALWAVILLKFVTPSVIAWPWETSSLGASAAGVWGAGSPRRRRSFRSSADPRARQWQEPSMPAMRSA